MRRGLIAFFLFLVAQLALASSAGVPGLPAAQLVGAGQFTKFGFSVYEARLWAPSGRYASNEPFALSLTYSREIAGGRLVQASLEEMEKLQAPVTTRQEWRGALERVLPNVMPGDSITGVYHPGRGASFFHQAQLTGRIDDELARHFFAIWLDPRTSEPGLRRALLGASQ